MPTDKRPRRFAATDLAIGAAYVAAYVVFDWASYFYPVGDLAITPWNPPPGLTLFVLVRFGTRHVPAVFVATILAELLVRGLGPNLSAALAGAGVIAAGYSAAGAVLARLLRPSTALETLKDVNLLVAVAAIGPAATGLAYVGLNVAAGLLPADAALNAFLQFWIGDALGIVVTTPLLLEFAERRFRWAPIHGPEAFGEAAAVIAAAWIVFGLSTTDEFKFFYLLFLPLILIAVRHGLRGAIVTSLAFELGLVAAGGNLATRGVLVWELQFLMLTLALTALYLGASITVGWRAQRAFNEREAALNSALRRATAGELATGLAHELNQPLAAIGAYVDSCAAMVARDSRNPALPETLAKAGREVRRAAAVVRRLRTSFRVGAGRRERVSAEALVRKTVQSVAARASEHRIAIDVDARDGLPPIVVDPMLIQMVLQNLLTNAVDALVASARDEPAILVRIEPGRAPDEVAIEVSDNGPGIAPELGERVFEQFASTKADGMGLGLSISRSIAESNRGTLTLAPPRLGGATFRLVLYAGRDDE